MSRRLSLLSRLGLLAAIVVVGLLVANSRTIRISYHLNRMQVAYDAIHAEPSVVSPDGLFGYGSKELFDRHDYHRDRLVDLGYFLHATFEMEHIPDSTDGVHRVLWEKLMITFPENRHFRLSYPDNVLEVWDLPSRRGDWESFVEKHNVTNFAEQFMNHAIETDTAKKL